MDPSWRIVDELSDEERRDVEALLRAIEENSRDEALTEDQRERLESGATASHALRGGPDGALRGYAIIGDGAPRRAEPALGTFDMELVTALEATGDTVSMLLRPVDDELAAALTSRGWRPTREVHRLWMPLPAEPPTTTGLTVRSFRPGVDDQAWVDQNNAAFKGHPTQADMTVERLRARFSADWFDPDGFLLFFDGDQLVASCWTKVHRCASGDVGEIYVISVAPDAQGRGLGRVAVLAGLQHLAAEGLATAELFVEETNRAAYALYRSLGFRLDTRVVEFLFDTAS
ncbi:MAG TPA: mycothiol synthase [Acidimicrobiales bacterium]|nr:mycothiol synthase [Acidimicrobiales bacterium]